MTTPITGLQTVLRSSSGADGLPLVGRLNRPADANDSLAHKGPIFMTTRPEPLIPSRLNTLRRGLGAADEELLRVLATVHLATTSQVQRLTLDRQPVRTAEIMTAQRLQRLRRLGLIRSFLRRPSDRRGGRPGYLHTLTADGLILAGGHYTIGGARPRASWRPGQEFVAHRLAITELYVRLVEHQRAGETTVRTFQAEPESWRHYTGPDGERLDLRPDALVRLEQAGVELSWFVEIDRGTEPARTLAAKCRNYRAYELSGIEQHRYQVFPGVAFLVLDSARQRLVERVITGQPDSARALFTVATEDQALDRLTDPDQPGGPELGREMAA